MVILGYVPIPYKVIVTKCERNVHHKNRLAIPTFEMWAEYQLNTISGQNKGP